MARTWPWGDLAWALARLFKLLTRGDLLSKKRRLDSMKQTLKPANQLRLGNF